MIDLGMDPRYHPSGAQVTACGDKDCRGAWGILFFEYCLARLNFSSICAINPLAVFAEFFCQFGESFKSIRFDMRRYAAG